MKWPFGSILHTVFETCLRKKFEHLWVPCCFVVKSSTTEVRGLAGEDEPKRLEI
jgi:hypothetical protein